MNPDLVALQEVDKNCKRSGTVDVAARLGALLEMHHVFGGSMAFQGGEYGVAVLSRYPIREAIRHELPPGAEPRCAQEVIVEPEGWTAPISFVSVHNDWTDGEARVRQVQALHQALQERDHPVILAGDFNGEATDPSMKWLAETAWTLVDNGGQKTYPSDEPNIEIDFFVIRNAPGLSVTCEVLAEPVASDHRPLYGILSRNSL
jgi:endonuclease/exonuclease/phosphatase family metal-dependent hydrolase